LHDLEVAGGYTIHHRTEEVYKAWVLKINIYKDPIKSLVEVGE
jgi:hypothetical protein